MTVRQLVVEARVRGAVNGQADGWVGQLVSHLNKREMSPHPGKSPGRHQLRQPQTLPQFCHPLLRLRLWGQFP